uniref:C2H2-type domain-containing protein n=1 Tax=Mycena chlorophos TaxID=658473 RepID=A0ABQ0LTN9_MYCCL|nr:predicted protein [Mycena chlorophos]
MYIQEINPTLSELPGQTKSRKEYKCRLSHCTSKPLRSVEEWMAHIEATHLAAAHSLPCPFQGCEGLPLPPPPHHLGHGSSARWHEIALLTHFFENHAATLGQSVAIAALKPRSTPFRADPKALLHLDLPTSFYPYWYPTMPQVLVPTEEDGTFAQFLARQPPVDAATSLPIRHSPRARRSNRMSRWPGTLGSRPFHESKLGAPLHRGASIWDDEDGQEQNRRSRHRWLSNSDDDSDFGGLREEQAQHADVFRQFKAGKETTSAGFQFLGTSFLQARRVASDRRPFVELVRPLGEPDAAARERMKEPLPTSIFFDALEAKVQEKKRNKRRREA